MRSDDVSLGEMIAAADQLLALLTNPQAERLLRQDRAFRHSVFFDFAVGGEGEPTLFPVKCGEKIGSDHGAIYAILLETG